MKRWTWVSGLVLILTLGVLVPVGARAATAVVSPAAAGLTSGKPVKATISSAGQEVTYTFPAKANKNVSFQVTHFDLTNNGATGGVYLEFFEPGSSSQYNYGYFSSNGYFNFSPPQSGTWSASLVPVSDSTGSLTLTFAANVATRVLKSAKAGTTTIKYQGQEAGYTFPAKRNKNVTFDISKFHFNNNGATGGVYLEFFEPGSSSQYNYGYFSSNGFYNFTPPESGTWSALLVPSSASVGNLTLTFAANVATKALKSGKDVTTTIKYQGQEAGYTFTTKKNKNVVFNVSKFHFHDNGSAGGVYLEVFEPGSSSQYNYGYFGSNGHYNFTAPVGGTWSALLVPSSASVGSLVLKES